MKRFLTILFVVAVTTAMSGCKCCSWKKKSSRGCTTGCSTCTSAPSLYDPGLTPPTIDYSTPADPQATYSIPQ